MDEMEDIEDNGEIEEIDGFTITFDQDFLDTLDDDSTITIDYSAQVNENAEIGNDKGNKSTLDFTYGENNIPATSGVATTYTYKFELVKTDEDKVILTGAKFKLYDAETSGNEIKVVKKSDGVYRIALPTETGVVIEAGDVTIEGIGNGTYYLEETDAPEGYNKLTSRQALTIKDNNEMASTTSTDYTQGGVQVINKAGTILPTTGGMGTTILYIIGGVLMIGAGVIFIARKKTSSAEK